mmetsp:Transcript_26229/g.4507  ORF Transcript_26229/g.4507 Transcript_26229/m.4507 type:complete len:105 (+) Transcript_26229:2935-3249(+)
MDSDWDPTMNSCTVENLVNLSNSSPITCTAIGNTFTIASFASFVGSKTITVTFEKVMPPPNSGNLTGTNAPNSNLFTSITTKTLVNGSDTEIDKNIPIANQVSV